MCILQKGQVTDQIFCRSSIFLNPYGWLSIVLIAYLEVTFLKKVTLPKKNICFSITNAYSSWREIFYGIPQWSIFGPLIFKFFLNLFYLLEGVAITSYAGDITPCSAKKTNKVVIKEIEHFSEVLFKWFDFNYMRINCQKRYILF